MKCITFGGEYGSIPLKSNSHGGIDLAMIPDGSVVYRLDNTPLEQGYIQVAARIIDDMAAKGIKVKLSNTGQYWLELTHLREVSDEVEPEQDLDLGLWTEYEWMLVGNRLFLREKLT